MQRPTITPELQKRAIDIVLNRFNKKLEKRGRAALASEFETFGRIQQELHEFEEALHMKVIQPERINELADVALYAIWGIASLLTGECDW